jgi:hypothetical protein
MVFSLRARRPLLAAHNAACLVGVSPTVGVGWVPT